MKKTKKATAGISVVACGKMIERTDNCMLDKLCLKNFKKFDVLELKNLSRVNLFVGDNNVGKTTALEAIFSFSCKNSLPAKITNELSHRGENEVRKIFVALERTGAMNELINETNKTFNLTYSPRLKPGDSWIQTALAY